jgi:hypothetical protein
MDLRNFFSSVKKKHHLANLSVQNFRDEEREAAEAVKKDMRRAQIEEQREADRLAARKRRDDARNAEIAEDKRTDEERVQDEIDGLAEEIPDLRPAQKKTKLWQSRPENWEDIAYDALTSSNDSAIKNFASDFEGVTSTAAYQRLNTWKKDLGKKKKVVLNPRLPDYGSEIDNLLLADFHNARSAGLSVDDENLRRYLVVHLTAAGKQGLLKEHGGKCTYGHSWAMRFYRRHNLVLRVCTSKMRELPQDFEEKKSKYLKIGAELIYRYRVPPKLVINGDETAVLLVSRANVTRNVVGSKRVRILGMGEDKAQITATIFATEAGDILPYQMIFQGTTERCHPPKGGKPDDCLWTHTKSHWQSPQTYIELLEKVVVPYKNNMILALRLPPTQGTILKHDLHYTHKDEAVLAFMKSHNIYPLFVPAGCTDVMQECDVVINKPFKNAVRKAYRDHIDDLFQVHKQSGAPVALFSPKLTMGALKPFLTGFVQRGILALKTPEMRACIQDSFANAGFFTAMRSDEMQQAMELQANQLDDNDQAIDEGHENEENVEELGFTSDAEELGVTSDMESGNESD